MTIALTSSGSTSGLYSYKFEFSKDTDKSRYTDNCLQYMLSVSVKGVELYILSMDYHRLGEWLALAAWGKYEKLAVNKQNLIEIFQNTRVIPRFNYNLDNQLVSNTPYTMPFNKMFLLPFSYSSSMIVEDGIENMVTIDNLNTLCQWVEKNQFNEEKLTVDEIKALYEELIDWIDNYLMKDCETWKKARGFTGITPEESPTQ